MIPCFVFFSSLLLFFFSLLPPHYVAPRRLSPPTSSTKEKRNGASDLYLNLVPPHPHFTLGLRGEGRGTRDEGHVVGFAAERILWSVLVRHLRTELCVFCCCRALGNGFDDVAGLILGVCVFGLCRSREKGALRSLVV
ncbi:hypothetical protein F5144DRAFT_379307 [Chaetomium tenue]|uniref:Uncharacterized protein n=1 Tax=Chaetomium tenue TaxID=1854479 RepID=A0ACB7NW40_9PEZI|nr:hypothetical protein F5144DRAFT_379307 [Chaetomium globosum]